MPASSCPSHSKAWLGSPGCFNSGALRGTAAAGSWSSTYASEFLKASAKGLPQAGREIGVKTPQILDPSNNLQKLGSYRRCERSLTVAARLEVVSRDESLSGGWTTTVT